MITFFSNFINEHQIPFCNAMYSQTNGDFRFVATEPISEERLQMGFSDQSDRFPYVVRSFLNNEHYQEALRLGRESDVVIIGSAPDEFIRERLSNNKLTFRYCERFFKQGRIRILDPRVLKARYCSDFRYRKKNLHMLCASAYTATDCRFIHSYPNKTYKWGYFPQVREYDIEHLINMKQPASILWVGRLIGLKHPESAINVAEDLVRLGVDFRMTIIGQGEMEDNIQKLICRKNLSNLVKMEGFIPPAQVRARMEKADIFLFTSDHNEGWGAVLNESMNAACAVVACNEIGSVPYLIKDGVNGLIYDRHLNGSLTNCVLKLLHDEAGKKNLQKEAYQTLQMTWNADEAAKRLLSLIVTIQENREPIYLTGPCSRD